MSQKSIAEILVETLVAAGVKRVYGVVGDSLNGILEEIGKRKDIEWIAVRHEETGAFAAGAQAHLTGELAVCAGSCGPAICTSSMASTIVIAAACPSWPSPRTFPAAKSEAIIFRRPTPTSSSRHAVTTASLFPSRHRCRGSWKSRFKPPWPGKVFPSLRSRGDIALKKTTYRKPSASIRRVEPLLRPSESESRQARRLAE